MMQIGAALGLEAKGRDRDRISGQSEVYRVRSRVEYAVIGANANNTAAGAKDVAGGTFLTRVVNGTAGRGRERVFVPEMIT
jgi:hypothetical protein